MDPVKNEAPSKASIVCDTYIFLSMCVRDLIGDGEVDIVYFTDTREIFMYREGMREEVGHVMPFHQCAVTLSEDMQATTNRILGRSDMSLNEELSITRALIANYMAAKPSIDACNASFEDEKSGGHEEDGFFIEEDWDV